MTVQAQAGRGEPGGKAATLSDIAQAVRESERLVIATHENPDGDAIGSARSMELVAAALGIDTLVYVPGGVVPREYEFIAPERLVSATPDDIGERTLLCLDCGQASRLANDELVQRAARILNVDHHADNTHFGDLNVVRGQVACTTQLVWELANELDVDLTPPLATALYVGLVTDTGRFQYSNTTAESLEFAACLVRAGVDVHDVFREVYERVEYPRLKLLARGLEKSQRYDGGRVVVTYLTSDDFRDAEADADSAEGIVDFLRGVEGALVALMVRDLDNGRAARKGSLRTTHDDIDVSTIARAYKGGGHRQAAGFTTDDDIESIIEQVRAAIREQQSD